MSEPAQGDIYIVDFDPSVGHEYRKTRPAVIVQSNRQLKRSNLITIIPLTSQTHNKHPDDILIRKSRSNRLFADSLIKVHSITSFDKRRVRKRVGIIDRETMRKVKDYLRKHFDL